MIALLQQFYLSVVRVTCMCCSTLKSILSPGIRMLSIHFIWHPDAKGQFLSIWVYALVLCFYSFCDMRNHINFPIVCSVVCATADELKIAKQTVFAHISKPIGTETSSMYYYASLGWLPRAAMELGENSGESPASGARGAKTTALGRKIKKPWH
jgi:hypothetical protein